MTIAIVINTSWNIFNFRKGLVQALLADGHRVIAIAPKDSYSKKLEDLGMEYIPLDMDSKGQNPIKDFLLIFKLRKIYKKHKLDAVLHYTIKPNIYGTLATIGTKTKAINNVSGLGTTFIRKNLITAMVTKLYRFAFKRAFHIFFQNPEDQRIFLNLDIVKPEQTSILPGSGVPLNEIKQEPLIFSNSTRHFLMTSRLLIDKGIEEFIEASRRIKAEFGDQVSITLCGSTENNPKLGFSENDAKQWNEEGFLNYIEHSDNVISLLKNSHIAVLPSYREGTPRALLEAGAVGRPILTTNTIGCKEVVEDGENGMLCKVKDINSLYNCMKKFVELSENELREMAEKSRKLVEAKFDEQIVINKYKEILNKL